MLSHPIDSIDAVKLAAETINTGGFALALPLGKTPGLPGLSAAKIRLVTAINRDRGITGIFIEQNVELALRLAHRGDVLESWRNVLEGPSATLVRRILLGT